MGKTVSIKQGRGSQLRNNNRVWEIRHSLETIAEKSDLLWAIIPVLWEDLDPWGSVSSSGDTLCPVHQLPLPPSPGVKHRSVKGIPIFLMFIGKKGMLKTKNEWNKNSHILEKARIIFSPAWPFAVWNQILIRELVLLHPASYFAVCNSREPNFPITPGWTLWK